MTEIIQVQLYPCATCQPDGSVDADPKVHYGEDRYHYGCLPDAVKADILGDQSTAPQRGLAVVIQSAERGVKGAQLRDKVIQIMSRVNQGAKNG